MTQPDQPDPAVEVEVLKDVVRSLGMQIAQLTISNSELDARYQRLVAAQVRAESEKSAGDGSA